MNKSEPAKTLSGRMAQSVTNRYGPAQMLWHYEHGLVLQSIYALGKALRNDEYLSWVRKMYDTKINDDGSINTYKKDEFNLDQINPGKLLFDLYQDTGNVKYKKAIEILHAQLLNHPRTQSNGFWHKQIYPWQMWLDGLYMQGPFYARWAAEYGTRDELADVVAQLVLVESRTRDPRTGLLFHAWDESRKQLWADRQTGCSPHFWGRAMGWYCMAVVDVLDYIPTGGDWEKERDILIAIARRLTSVLLKYQDPKTSLWYQILDQGAREKNYLETSASSMFVYFLFKILRKGYVSERDISVVEESARAGYQGIVGRMLREDASGSLHLGGICSVAGLGGNPYRDGSFDYYVSEPVVEDDFKGVGPFILASLEAENAQISEKLKSVSAAV